MIPHINSKVNVCAYFFQSFFYSVQYMHMSEFWVSARVDGPLWSIQHLSLYVEIYLELMDCLPIGLLDIYLIIVESNLWCCIQQFWNKFLNFGPNSDGHYSVCGAELPPNFLLLWVLLISEDGVTCTDSVVYLGQLQQPMNNGTCRKLLWMVLSMSLGINLLI